MRTEEHLRELQTLTVEFERQVDRIIELADENGEAGGVVLDRYSELWEVNHYQGLRIAVVVGEVLYNLRSALDYLVFELALLDSGIEQSGTQFPICDTPDDFASQRFRLRGVRGGHVAVIGSLQPYQGMDWALALQFLSNQDKHRRMHAVSTELDIDFLDYSPVSEEEYWALWGRIVVAQEDIDIDFDLTTYIAFEDGSSVTETLQLIHTHAADIVASFKSCFAGVCPHGEATLLGTKT